MDIVKYMILRDFIIPICIMTVIFLICVVGCIVDKYKK